MRLILFKFLEQCYNKHCLYFFKTSVITYSILDALWISKMICSREELVGSVCLQNLYQLLTK